MTIHPWSMVTGAAIVLATLGVHRWLVGDSVGEDPCKAVGLHQLESRIEALEEQGASVRLAPAESFSTPERAPAAANPPEPKRTVEIGRLTDKDLDAVDPRVLELLKLNWIAACDNNSGLRDVLARANRCPTDRGVLPLYLHAREAMNDALAQFMVKNEAARAELQALIESTGTSRDTESLEALRKTHPETFAKSAAAQDEIRDATARIQKDLDCSLRELN